MNYVWDFGILWKYSFLFWWGTVFTFLYTIGTSLLGALVGFVCAMIQLKKLRLANVVIIGYIELFRCTPLLVQIIWFYYAFPVIIGVNIPAHVAATGVLTLYVGAFYAEIFRGGIESIEAGQWDAGKSLGLSPWLVLRLVVLPQAVRRMLPPFVNQTIIQLKNTSLISVIAVPDLVYNATLITAETYRPLEVYTIVAAIYFLVLFPATLFARRLGRTLADERETV
jgi:polar amino acid transport system permease protein